MAGVFDIELDGGEPHRYGDSGVMQEEMEDDQMYSNVADGVISAPPPSSSFIQDPMVEAIDLSCIAVNQGVRVGP
ncbi:hypothetical protein COOONC_08572, partial [Cooperia oncophora]